MCGNRGLDGQILGTEEEAGRHDAGGGDITEVWCRVITYGA